MIDAGRHAHADIRGALVREVRRLAGGLAHEPVPDGVGVDFTRSKVEPMVRGLFPRAEQGTVLAILEQSVVFPHYEPVTDKPGYVLRVEEDGTKTVGRFVKRRWVAQKPRTK